MTSSPPDIFSDENKATKNSHKSFHLEFLIEKKDNEEDTQSQQEF